MIRQRQLTPARAFVAEVLGYDPGSAWPTSGYGDKFLLGIGLGGSFGGVETWHRRITYRNRTAQGEDPWASAVVLAAEEAAWRNLGGYEALLAVASVILAQGDAWLVCGAT